MRAMQAAVDPDVEPCTDFYQHACGGWLGATALPVDRAHWVRSFDARALGNAETLRAILEPPPAASSSPASPLRVFYAGCMDEAAVERAGLAPIEPLLEQIAAVHDPSSLAVALATLHRAGVPAALDVRIAPDRVTPRQNVVHLTAGALGLGDRSRYLARDRASRELRARYREHVTRMLAFLGSGQPATRGRATRILTLETALARNVRSGGGARPPIETSARVARRDLTSVAPGLPWNDYLAALGAPLVESVALDDRRYVARLPDLLRRTPLPVIRAFLRWRVLHHLAAHLPRRVAAEGFRFAAVLAGQEPAPRWRRCVDATGDALGDLLGRAFVERVLPEEALAQATDVVERVRVGLGELIADAEWMDDPTRTRACAKLDAVRLAVGHPRWQEHAGPRVQAGAYLENLLVAQRFERARELATVGAPVDRGRWQVAATSARVLYDRGRNELVVPAGMLQPPFFDAGLPMAVNLGGIGVLVGHELSHGFDDRGRRFDGTGRRRPWWSTATLRAFRERVACVVERYDGLEPGPELQVDGRRTAEETLADWAGVRAAQRALRRWMDEELREDEETVRDDGRLFFASFAQTWCTLETPEESRRRLVEDPQAPPRFRVNGTLASLPPFADAFGCPEDAPMRGGPPCAVW